MLKVEEQTPVQFSSELLAKFDDGGFHAASDFFST